MGSTDAQKRAVKKYRNSKYARITIDMSKKEKETIDFYCKSHNISKAGFIRAAVWEKMEREKGIPELPEIEENTNTDQKED